APLRIECYTRLRRHWQFINELKLFDIANLASYSVSIYGNAVDRPGFLHASSLYHPSTVTNSLLHDGTGPPPGIKTDAGTWDLSPHKDRVTRVGMKELSTWHSLLEQANSP